MAFKMGPIKNYARLQKKINFLGQRMVPVYKKTMIEALLVVKRESMINTPVDTSNLRASHDIKIGRTSERGISGTVFNSASYAWYVHEFTWMRLNNGVHKFLELALQTSRAKIKRLFVYNINKSLKDLL